MDRSSKLWKQWILSFAVTAIPYVIWEFVWFGEPFYRRTIPVVIVHQITFWITHFVLKRRAATEEKPKKKTFWLTILPLIAVILFMCLSWLIFLVLLGREITG